MTARRTDRRTYAVTVDVTNGSLSYEGDDVPLVAPCAIHLRGVDYDLEGVDPDEPRPDPTGRPYVPRQSTVLEVAADPDLLPRATLQSALEELRYRLSRHRTALDEIDTVSVRWGLEAPAARPGEQTPDA